MPRAMLLRVKRLEAMVRPARLAVGAAQSGRHEFMRRLAVYPDLFDEFMDIAEGAQMKTLDMLGVGQLARQLTAKLTAREARS